MTRAEIKETIRHAIKHKVETIAIQGNFGCGEEVFIININHIHKVFCCKDYFPICVLNDIYENGYNTFVGVSY